MVLPNQHFSLHLLLVIFTLNTLISASHSSSSCNQSCNHRTKVPYPFGFSKGCKIPLQCKDDGAYIGEFKVTVTGKDIVVHVPIKCNRSIHVLAPLFSRHYAPTTNQTFLILHDCSSSVTGCSIPKALMNSSSNYLCGGSPSCYSVPTDDNYLHVADLERNNCSYLTTSVTATFDIVSNSLSLQLETIHLRWGLAGECSCSPNASCTKFPLPANHTGGYRCQCAEGFKGDGFMEGNGCKQVLDDCDVQKYLRGHCGGAKLRVLIGCFFAGACLVIGLGSLCYVIRKRNKASKSRESTRKLLSEAAVTFTVPFYSYKEIERATFCFAEKYRLGNGAYGTVYAGKLHNEEWVAIKKIRHRDREGMDSIMNEIKLISSVNHPNLVHLLGFCLEKDEQILVYEFMPNGTLSQHLQRERGTGLPWTIRLNIATETAHAIAHLHSMDPPIFHRDIKSSNILLDTNLNSKVADFGLSRIGMPESSHISTAPQGTPGYLDPQYHQNFHLSDKSDVYSFGVVLVEIITAMKVVDFSRSQSEVNLAALAIEKIGKGCLDEIIDPFLESARDAWTLSSIHKMAELAFRCLAFHKDVRPSMIEVAAELEQIKLSGWAPLEASCYSSPSKGSDSMKSQRSIAKKETLEKTALGSRRVVSTQVKDWSPISVNEPWLSEQSSPSTNSFGKPRTQ